MDYLYYDTTIMSREKSPDGLEGQVDGVQIQEFGIKGAADPASDFLVPGMLDIGECSTELHVTRDATDIFGWTGARTIEAERGSDARCGRNDRLNVDVMPPAITEVIGVGNAAADGRGKAGKIHPTAVDGLHAGR